jgi:hypothetical protein
VQFWMYSLFHGDVPSAAGPYSAVPLCL